MRRFELIEGTSSKFWEVGVTDADVTVTYGRIGTAGQSKTKTFASNAAALAEEAKLIKEKTGKGYGEVGAANKPESGAQEKVEKSEKAKKSAPRQATEQAVAEPEAATKHAVELDWPQGGFSWSDELRAELPVVRGIRIPSSRSAHDLPTTIHEAITWITFLESRDGSSEAPSFADDKYASAQEGWSELRQAGADLEGGLWTEAEATDRIQPGNLQHKDMNAWRQLFYQCAARRRYTEQDHLNWVTERAVALHGPAFAVETLLSCGMAVAQRIPYYVVDRYAYGPLRNFIAGMDDTEYRLCVAAAETWRGRSEELDCVVSYLFPERSDWANACADYKLPENATWWLDDSAMSVEAACRHTRRRAVRASYAIGKALLLIHLHGEAALPFLELLLDKVSDKDDTLRVLKVLLHMWTPGVIPALVARMENREARAALDQMTERWPAAILKCAVERAHASRSRAVENWAVRLALRLPTAVEPALAACGSTERERFSALLAEMATPAEASAEALPELLRSPPWTHRTRAAEIPVLTLTPHQQAEEMVWPEGDAESVRKQAQAKKAIDEALAKRPDDAARQARQHRELLGELCVAKAAHPRILAGETLRPEDLEQRPYYYISPTPLLRLPVAAAAAVWNGMPARHWVAWSLESELNVLLATFGLNLLPGVLNLVSAHPETGLSAALPCRSGRLAPLAAHALKNTKKGKAPAMAWLRHHTETAIEALIPDALGKDRVPRENAQFCLRWLAKEGHEAKLREIAASYGNEAAAAVECMLAIDPLLVVPARMPKIPTFFVPAAFRRPVLKAGGALPLEAAGFIGNMLSISSLEAPYGGLEAVKAACTAASLAEFAWDLFEAWLSAGAPSKEAWAFQALGLLGDDETARRLAPRIREWPGESAHARAVVGLDILAAIGSDVALMHLNAIAAKVKFKGLQEKAKEKIAQVAEARDLTPEELADRLVPDLGLDENGTLELNFGPRRFFVSFDETLKPFVKDEGGARLKDLPKPNKSDDETLATEAVERYKAIKKDAKSIASMQLIRLEQGMCGRRRWSPENFRLFFLDHPLMRHLSRRLVWGAYRDSKLVHAFRVAEDLTLADASDDLFELPSDVEVGVAHVLELPAELARDFGQVFADYEILQPFRQLGREIFAPSEEEKRDKAITRFKDKTVATGSIMGLTNRGWERGDAQDAGWVGWFTKRLPGSLEANLNLDPGTVVGDMSYEPKQRIPSIEIRRQGSWDDAGKVDLATVDPIVVSELIRDADLLAPFDPARP